MRKTLYTFAFCLLLPQVAFSQIAGDTNQHKLKGSVKTVRIETSFFSDKDGKFTETPRVVSSEYTYNPIGRLIESTVNNFAGSPYAKYQAVYNGKLKAEESYYKPKGDLVDKMVYSYDASGRLVEKTVEKAKKSPSSKSIFTYDDKGRIIEKLHKNIKGSGGYKVVYLYDDAQIKIEETAYDLKGARISRRIDRYDKEWRLIERESYLNTGPRLWKSSFAYDVNGNISEETFNIFDVESKWRHEYEVDSSGNWSKRMTYSLTSKNGVLKFEPVQTTYRTITYNPAENESQVGPLDLASIILIRETNSYLPAEAVKRVEPVYTAEAKLRRESGSINVFVMVDETGNVISSCAAPRQPQSLSIAATAAAWAWKLNPTVSGGIAIKFVGPLHFNFNL